jgi:DNA-binding transcriptional LysR family regulator
MQSKWLEDFVSLAETRSFSRSAQLRHVTQPAELRAELRAELCKSVRAPCVVCLR